MSLRVWALKPKELKPLSRAELLLLCARFAMRIAAFRPTGAEACWDAAMARLVGAAFSEVSSVAELESLRRDVRNRGALACNAVQATDVPLGSCLNYATGTLALGLQAATLPAGADLTKVVIDCAKNAASIPATLAHAGRLRGKPGEDVVDATCAAMWATLRADAAALVGRGVEVERSADPVTAARHVVPLWPDGLPAWLPRTA